MRKSLLILLFLLSSNAFSTENCTKSESGIARATCFMKQGQVELDRNQFKTSVETFLKGIEELGNSYNSNMRSLDDTGQKSVFAKFEHEKGNIESASNLYRGVLESRLSMAKSNED